MEDELGIIYRSKTNKKSGIVDTEIDAIKCKIAMVRYADDFVIMCETKEEAENMYIKLKPYLQKRGLELAPDKTKVTHVTKGFDFLGFNVRRYTNIKGNQDRSKLLIKPSKASIKEFKAKIKEVFETLRGTNVGTLIRRINPIIRGTANYWKTVVSKEIFGALDHYIWSKTYKFLRQLHPTKSWRYWITKRYFKKDIYGVSKDKWLLTDPKGKYQIRRMAWTEIKRHELIKYKNSPFNATLKEYYERRDIKEFERNSVEFYQKLAKKQKYKCPFCGMSVIDFKESIERHHKVARAQGGDNTMKNSLLVHTSCHISWHKEYPARKGAFIPGDKEIFAFRNKK